MELSNDFFQLKQEVAVLEVKVEEYGKLLKQIPRIVCNRKLVAKYKKNMNEAEEHLAAKKKELECLFQTGLNDAAEQFTAKNKEPECRDNLMEFWK
jgi:competence CoiA-like predicted nuclease